MWGNRELDELIKTKYQSYRNAENKANAQYLEANPAARIEARIERPLALTPFQNGDVSSGLDFRPARQSEPSNEFNITLDENIRNNPYATKRLLQNDLREQRELLNSDHYRNGDDAQESLTELETNRAMYGNPMAQQMAFMRGQNRAVDTDVAKLQLDYAERNLNTRTENDDKYYSLRGGEKSRWYGDIGQQLADTPIRDYLPYAGMSESAIVDVVDKKSKGEELNQSEQALLNSYYLKNQTEQYIQDDGGATVAAGIGSMGPGSTKFLGEIALTGGSLGITKGIAKGIAKGTVKLGAKAVAKAAGKMMLNTGKMMWNTAKIEAARTPFMSSFYDGITQKTLDQYDVYKDAQGNIKSELTRPTSYAERLRVSYGETFTETYSEQFGNLFGGRLINKIAPKLLGRKIGGLICKLSPDGKQGFAASFTRGLQKHLNWNNTANEFLEEKIGDLIRPILTGNSESWENFFDARQNAITLGSVAAMGGAMHVAQAPLIVADEIRSGKAKSEERKHLKAISSSTIREGMLTAMSSPTIETRAQALKDIDWSASSKDDVLHAVDYFVKRTEREVVSGAIEAQADDANVVAQIDTATKWYEKYSNKDSGKLILVEDGSGQRYYLRAGTLENDSEDNIRNLSNVETGKDVQMPVDELHFVEQTDFGSIVNAISENIAQTTEQKITQADIEDIVEDAQVAGVSADAAIAAYNGIDLSAIEGSEVVLADGRTVRVGEPKADKTGYTAIYQDPTTGDEQSVDIAVADIASMAHNGAPDVESLQPQSQKTDVTSDEQIEQFIANAQSQAIPAPQIELNGQNWEREFGSQGVVQTPIGDVKVGDNQYLKLIRNKRESQFGMIRPTLSEPDFIIQETSFASDEQTERDSSLLFVKSFVDKQGKKQYLFTSVTVQKDGLEISVSNHIKRESQIKKAIKEGKLLYVSTRLDVSGQTSLEQQPNAHTGAPSEDKDINNEPNNQNIPLIEKGGFGNIYTQFKGKAKAAIDFLLQRKEGEAVAALTHPQLGYIDLVWGKEGTAHSDGYGLSKIAKYHPEVLPDLQEILNSTKIVAATNNRAQLESDTHKAIIRLEWNGESKSWLLTAFEKETPTSFVRTTDVGENPLGEQNDTAPLLNVGVSDSKDINKVPNKQNIPLTKAGEKDYDAMAAPMLAEQLQQDLGSEGAAASIGGAITEIDKQIAAISKRRSTSLNTISKNRLEISRLTARKTELKAAAKAIATLPNKNQLYDGQTDNNTSADGGAQGETIYTGQVPVGGTGHIDGGGVPASVSDSERTQPERPTQSSEVESDIRFSDIEPSNTEIEQIKSAAIKRGDFLKAPNGEPSNLTERQWLQVRTAAFKEWFGDWEKAARIEKLYNSASVKIAADQYSGKYELNYKSAQAYISTNLTGRYTIDDTAELIELSRVGARKVTSHNTTDVAHLQSIVAIPQLIKNAIFITEQINEKDNSKYDSYRYYVSGLSIDDVDYTVRITVGVKNGKRYYDHGLTEIEKGTLIDSLKRTRKTVAENKSSNIEEQVPLSAVKDKRLISILQNNSSKVVDANGEPSVVYHGTGDNFTEFKQSEIRDVEGSFFFAQNQEEAQGYVGDGNTMSVFVNLRNPADFENLPNNELYHLNSKRAIVQSLIALGYDGWMSEMESGWGEVSAFYPHQIKSAADNNGEFNPKISDIRFSESSTKAERIEIEKGELLSKIDTLSIVFNANNPPVSDIKDKRLISILQDNSSKVEVSKQLQALARKFGVGIEVVENVSELPEGLKNATRSRRFKGLYHKSTGKVYFVLSELTSTNDATATFLHEVVAHKGIDGLMGRENADKFYTSVFDSLPKREQERLLKKYGGNKVVAGDETVAQVAQGGVEPNITKRILAAVRRFFRSVLHLPLNISDNDIRYILFQSKNNLEKTTTIADAMEFVERDKQPVSPNVVFNSDLDNYINRTIKANEYLRVGNPQGVLKQILPNLPIIVRQRVINKGLYKKHTISVDTLKNLPQYLSAPVFIFQRDVNSIGILIDRKDELNRNICVAIQMSITTQDGGQFIEVNNISTIHGRELVNVIEPIIENETLIWVDKQKGLDYLSSAQLNGQEIDQSDLISVTKVIKDFENPTTLAQNDDLRFSEVEGAPYNALDSRGNALKVEATLQQENWQDSTVRVKLMQHHVKARGGNVNITNDVHTALNLVDSRANVAMDKYFNGYVNPIIKHIKTIGKSYETVGDYLLAKCSIERNDSGTAALAKDDAGEWNRQYVQQLISDFENSVPKEQIDTLWELVRAANKRSLDIAVNSGRMSRQQVRDIEDRGWKFYVPLRGKDFDFEKKPNLTDIYDYLHPSSASTKAATIANLNVHAKGRSSKAADPLATMQYMTDLEIIYGERNKALQTLLRLVEHNKGMTDMFSVNDEWFVKVGEKWVVATEAPSEQDKAESWAASRKIVALERKLHRAQMMLNKAKIESVEKQIAQQRELITVHRQPTIVDRAYKGITAGQRSEHDIKVMRNGILYTVKMADPTVAAAITGANMENAFNAFFGNKVMAGGTRILSALSTSKNPAFIPANFIRDVQHAALYNLIDSEGNFTGYMKYAFTSFKVIDRALRNKAQSLTVAELDGLDVTKATDRELLIKKYGSKRIDDTLYDLFLENGGQTGYVHIDDVKNYSKKIERKLRRASKSGSAMQMMAGINTGLDYMATITENATRYATFMGQIENGKDVVSAVKYAKNITVNFNTKGKYSRGMGAAYMFFNASVQGVDNMYKVTVNNKGKVTFAIASLVVAGYLAQMLQAAMLDAMGDDDWQISDYERKVNLIVPIGDSYVKIPIPILFRPAWNIGVAAHDYSNDKLEISDAMSSVLGSAFSSVSPVDIDSKNPSKALWPSLVKPIAEINVYNTNFMGRPINRRPFLSSQEGLVPDSELGQKNAPKFLKTATKRLNELGGGNEFTPAGMRRDGSISTLANWLDISPSTIEHILTSFTGGVGGEINKAAHFITDNEKKIRDIPIVNRFWGEPYKVSPGSQYWKISKQIELQKSVYQKSVANGTTNNWADTPQQFKEQADASAQEYRQLKATEKQIKEFKKTMENMTEGTPEFEQMQSKIENRQREFIKWYNDDKRQQ